MEVRTHYGSCVALLTGESEMNQIPFRGCVTKLGVVQPEGRVYLVSLPICDVVPTLRTRTLYAHRQVGDRKGWAVTDAATGRRIASGSTRMEAVGRAREALLMGGDDKLKAALSQVEEISEKVK